MAEYVDRDAVYKVFCAQMRLTNLDHHKRLLMKAQEAFLELPVVDAEPVTHGRWIRGVVQNGDRRHKCSACRDECRVPTCVGKPIYDYCPNCGAKMDLEGDDG